MHTARLPLLPLLGLLCLSGAASAVTYNYTGKNFTLARGAYTTAMSVSGQFTVDTPLASNLVIHTNDIRAQVTDYSFFDGVQTLTPANSKLNFFSMSTDGAGLITAWDVRVFATPVTTASGGTVAGIHIFSSNGDEGFLDNPCIEFNGPGGECSGVIGGTGPNVGENFSPDRGDWSCSDCPIVYAYAGANFTSVAGAYVSSVNISGQFTVASQLPSLMPSTDISAQVIDYRFDDGVQTLTPANSKILAFFVATGTAGNVINWAIAVWGTPLTTMVGGPVAGINLDGTGFSDNAFTDEPCAFTGGPGGECNSLAGLTGGTNYAFAQTTRGNWSCDSCVAIPVPQAQVWTESADAPSFPDGAAQVTRGQGRLTAISGATDSGSGDLRDAYCVRVTDPVTFLATTDPATDPAANSQFDSRLFLLRPDGAPRVANANVNFPVATLTGAATDGLGFVLGQPGEYVLTVGGEPDDPQDAADVGLFDIESTNRVLSPNPAAGRFDHWEGGTPASGAYTVILNGAEPCQGDLDAVFANFAQAERACLGDDAGGFSCRDVSGDSDTTTRAALGFVNADRHLDGVFAVENLNRNRVCLGNGAGGFTCSDVSLELESSKDVALGFVDGDQILDAVFANVQVNLGVSENRVCLGDGSGGFTLPCSNVSADQGITQGVALGFINGDQNLDAVFANDNSTNRVCLGDGTGAFSCSDVSAATGPTFGVALGLVNGDPHPDAVFVNPNQASRVCFGDGSGAFTSCTDASADTNATSAVALGFLNGDANLDAVFSNAGSENRVCLGDGSGAFPACSNVSADQMVSQDVALGLINGDTHLDAVFANEGERNRVCFGDGAGGFTSCSDMTEFQLLTQGVALGEVAPQRIFSDGFESGDTPPF